MLYLWLKWMYYLTVEKNKMTFDKNTVFWVTEDGIPVTLGAGEGLPFCCAWDKKDPREFSLAGVEFYPATQESFEEARKACQAES